MFPQGKRTHRIIYSKNMIYDMTTFSPLSSKQLAYYLINLFI